MCGIAGIFSKEVRPKQSLEREAGRMIRRLAHRGPDHEGIWRDDSGHVCLAHRRLAIIDLSDDGNQPMQSDSGNHVLVFNGEIYNYVELQRELISEGVTFRGHSDSEVLLAAIELWGIGRTLDRLIGMFAFAVWDKAEKSLKMARDRGGQKPLYYSSQDGVFYFGSEIKSLRASQSLSLNVDHESIHHFLTLGYIPAPRTIYQEIRELPAGSWMEVDGKFAPDVRRYWSLRETKIEKISWAEAIEETERLLTDSVRLRLRSDVPVGAFLSGGIDSGLLVSIASNILGGKLRTFTVSFDEGTFDESPLAQRVADRYGTDHQEIRLSPQLEDLLPRVVTAYDEPFADPSALPTYAIAQAAGAQLKVVLNGEGADELFAGYRRHLAFYYMSKIESVAGVFPPELWRSLGRILPTPRESRSPYAHLYRFIRGVGRPSAERYLIWSSDGFDEREKQSLYRPNSGDIRATADLLASELDSSSGRGTVSDWMAADFTTIMGDSLLMKMDIATMAHGLEARSPFLDHRLAEWATSLPRELLFSGRSTKPLLREIGKDYLPVEVLTAPKRGFEIPLVEWLEKDLFPMTRDLCLSENGIISQLFEKKPLEQLVFNKDRLNRALWAKRMWRLLTLALWERHCYN